MPAGERQHPAGQRRQTDPQREADEKRHQQSRMVAGEIAKPGADADAERIERQKTQPAEQRPGAVGKAERHADDDGGKRDLRFAAQHPDQERDTDIDQELQAAANMARIDMKPESRAARLGLRPRVRCIVHAVRLSGRHVLRAHARFGRPDGGGSPRFSRNPSKLLR